MRFKQLLFAAILTTAPNAFAESDPVELMWRARGLQADETLTARKEKKSLTDKERCEFPLEIAYRMFAVKPKSVITKGDGGPTYSIMFPDIKSNEVTTLHYLYNSGESKPTAWKVEKLASGWWVGEISSEGSVDTLIGSGDCYFILNRDNPLQIVAVPSNLRKKKK